MPMSRSPRRIAALMGGRCRDAGAGHSACRERGSGRRAADRPHRDVRRVGRDRELDYPGGSALIDPMGVTVFGGGDRAAVLSAEVNPGAVRATRQNFPFLADRR
jgi:predicted amidohydrolase